MRIAIIIFITTLFTLSTGLIYLSTSKTNPHPANQSGQQPTHTLTEFGDFACPHCANFALRILPELQKEFITPGLLNFQYKHYPFISPGSYIAAQAAECARDQNAFHDYHLRIYQSSVTNPTMDVLTPTFLTNLAHTAGLDTDLFQHCLTNAVHKDKVQQDKETGKKLAVNGTPALFLNGQRIRWKTYQDLHGLISGHLQEHETLQAPTNTP